MPPVYLCTFVHVYPYILGIPDHLTCILRNLYAGQEATVRTGHGTTDRFQIGKAVHQGGIYCHRAYLTYMQSLSCEMSDRKRAHV